MAEYDVDGTVYDFPDDYTDEDAVRILKEQGIIKPAVPDAKMSRLTAAPPIFAPEQETEAAARKRIEDEVREEMIARSAFTHEDARVATRDRLERMALDKQKKEREKLIQAGGDPEEAGSFPFFRATRIKEVPTFDREGNERVERLYIDPETGTPRVPTTMDEVVESFARQPILGEESARRASAEIQRQQRVIDAKRAKKEDIGLTEFAGPVFSGILSEPTQGSGVTETGLGAALRSTLGWVSALGAEGYFRGLGYEVDEAGLPLDPDDFGFAVAQAREKLGLPATIGMTGPGGAAALVGPVDFKGGLAPVPLPGVATRSQQGVPTTFDPEARRTASSVPVPPFTEDPMGFLRAETRRVAQNVASGRTLGDEFRDAPEVTEAYENVWGSPDAAFYGGSLGEVFIPAGPGTAVRATSGALKAVAKTPAARKAAEAAIKAAEAARAGTGDAPSLMKRAQAAALYAQGFVPTARLPGAADAPSMAQQVKAAALGLGADVASVVVPGRASDGRVVRRVAVKVLSRLGYSDEQVATLSRSIKPTSNTVKDVMGDLEKPLSDLFDDTFSEFQRILRLLEKNVPDDLVMVTENVAVPRALERDARAVLAQARTLLFGGDPASIASQLRAMANDAEAGGNTALKGRLRETAKAIEGAKYLTPAKVSTVSQNLLSQAAKRADEYAKWKGIEDPAFGKSLIRPSPKTAAYRVGGIVVALQNLLDKYASWDDVPIQLRRVVTTMVEDDFLAREMGAVNRKARDLTAAQVAIKQTERNLDAVLKSPAFDGPSTRKGRALFRPLETETVSVAQAQQQIRAAAKTALPRVSKRLNELANKLGNVDDAMDALLDEALLRAPEDFTPKKAWKKVLDALYGGDKADNIMVEIVRRNLTPVESDGEFRFMPTIKAVMDIDRVLVDENVLPGIVGRGPLSFFAPEFHKGFLKVVLEESVKKDIAKRGRTVEGALSGQDDGIFAAHLLAPATMMSPDQAKRVAFPGMSRLPSVSGSNRVRVYDPSASNAERVLADNGEEFAELIESVSPRMRKDVVRMAMDAQDFLIAGVARNVLRNAKYGYVLPNLPYLSYRLLEVPIISLMTVGLETTLQGAKRLLTRKLQGGGLLSDDGIYYSPKVLGQMAEEYGIGYTRVESERVGTLADDLLRDARKAAEGKDPDAKIRFRWPVDKSFWTRTAEALERTYRQSVFEVGLMRGDTPQLAAETARRSQFDYDALPDPVRTQAAQYFAGAAGTYAMHTEFARALMSSPSKARAAYKAAMAKQRVQDPYQVHGDKALTALGIWHADDATFYGPDLPIFAPVETLLGFARQGNLMFDDLKYASEVARTAGDVGTVFFAGGERVVQSLADELLPAVYEAYDRFQDNEGSGKKGASGPEPISDEKMFWAAAVVAQSRGVDSWRNFLTWFDPIEVAPPKGMEHPTIEGAWKAQPPEGVPHLLMGRDENNELPFYLVFKPSQQGLRNISILRGVTPDGVEALAPLYAASVMGEEGQPGTPKRIYPEGLIGSSAKGAAMQAAFTTAQPGTPLQLRAKQAEEIRKMREGG